MGIITLNDESVKTFGEKPEFAQNLQFGLLEDKIVLVVGGLIGISTTGNGDVKSIFKDIADLRNAYINMIPRGFVILDDSNEIPASEVIEGVMQIGIKFSNFGNIEYNKENKRANVGYFYVPFDSNLDPDKLGIHWTALLQWLSVLRTLAPAPPLPAMPISHLPFASQSIASEPFYRCEPWPTSRRINQATGSISPGTYASPQLELPFLPSGFAAVTRNALQSPLPARFRWELRPPANTPLRCGAGLPMFGQSGGGVEVMFQNGFTNVGPIANPVVLPLF